MHIQMKICKHSYVWFTKCSWYVVPMPAPISPQKNTQRTEMVDDIPVYQIINLPEGLYCVIWLVFTQKPTAICDELWSKWYVYIMYLSKLNFPKNGIGKIKSCYTHWLMMTPLARNWSRIPITTNDVQADLPHDRQGLGFIYTKKTLFCWYRASHYKPETFVRSP